jgi:hypothetical protein
MFSPVGLGLAIRWWTCHKRRRSRTKACLPLGRPLSVKPGGFCLSSQKGPIHGMTMKTLKKHHIAKLQKPKIRLSSAPEVLNHTFAPIVCRELVGRVTRFTARVWPPWSSSLAANSRADSGYVLSVAGRRCFQMVPGLTFACLLHRDDLPARLKTGRLRDEHSNESYGSM